MTAEEIRKRGYDNPREIAGRGWCAIMPMLFTTGLFYGLDTFGPAGRYCYANREDAGEALEKWTGDGDPPGPWIKEKPSERRGPGNPEGESNDYFD